jgi:tetratricopeptide (TPR) repeat protein
MKFKFFYSAAIGFALLLVAPQSAPALFARQQQETIDHATEARKWLNDGVEAFRKGRIDEAIEDFKSAKELDPSLVNARLYLATAYSAQYIPGASSSENTHNAEQAVEEFTETLEKYPNNLSAVDGIASILYNTAGTPFSEEKMQESKSYHLKHIALRPDDPEPHYWVGVIDWTITFRANQALRAEWMKKTSRELPPENALPEEIRQEFAAKSGDMIQEGIENLKKAMTLRSDYDDAMAYLDLLYRQKADMESSTASRDEDLKIASELVDQVKAIKEKQMNQGPR